MRVMSHSNLKRFVNGWKIDSIISIHVNYQASRYQNRNTCVRNKNKKQSENHVHKIIGKLCYHPLSVISIVVFIGLPPKSIG